MVTSIFERRGQGVGRKGCASYRWRPLASTSLSLPQRIHHPESRHRILHENNTGPVSLPADLHIVNIRILAMNPPKTGEGVPPQELAGHHSMLIF